MAVVRAVESPNSASTRGRYHVFLSFRGEDVRKTFLDHLYTACVESGFHTFRDDDEIERGENIKLELEEAIRESRVSVVVLSKDYAFSSWCLDELVMILFCRSMFGQVVLPVFYGVDPSDVRKQKGRFEEAFRRHEELANVESDGELLKKRLEKVKKWREALTQVADLAGLDLQNMANGHESSFIHKIIKVISDKLNITALHIANYPVGLHSRAKSINQWIEDGSSSVNTYLICGMGGIGKTTVAKYVYNLNSERFVTKCFLANVRETSEQSNGLLTLQKQLLLQILKMREININSVDEGIAKIIDAMRCVKGLFILDDVSEIHQLDALLGTREFYPGSKIIITTRNRWLLKACDIHKVYIVEPLDDDESLKLFSQNAFGQDYPLEDYMELSRRVMKYCGGVPLAHKLLGSSLLGKSLDVWESKLKKLEAFPDAQIMRILKVSYDSLQDDHDKRLFLNIACFFVGKRKDDTLKILDGCGFFTTVGIENLKDRCLLVIEEDDKLMMHQLVRDMGREIIRNESPEEPERRSMLWHHEDSFKILKEGTGTKTVEGIILNMQIISNDGSTGPSSHVDNVEKNIFDTSSKRRYLNFRSWLATNTSSTHLNQVELRADAFTRMINLKLLQLDYVKLRGSFIDFPQNLRWLSWHGFPLKSIPMDFQLIKLVVLGMSYSKLEHVWVGSKCLGSLKILDLSYSKRLIKTPDFSGAPNVEKLILCGCVNLVEVCESVIYLERLILLDLQDCKSLRKLPNIGSLKWLETFILSNCSCIIGLPSNPSNMKSLEVLNADKISTTDEQVKYWHLFALSFVSNPIKPVLSLNTLPQSLVKLSLKNCNLTNDCFPKDSSSLALLKHLELSENPIHSLPDCVGSLINLQELRLNSCTRLRNVLGLPNVEKLHIGGSTLVQRISYQSTSFLSNIIEHTLCSDLVDIQNVAKVQPIKEVDKELISSLGWSDTEAVEDREINFLGIYTDHVKKCPIQGLYEFGIFSTFLPGGKVPSWFSDKRMGSSISFTVPRLSNNFNIQGLNVCSVYGLSNNEGHWYPPLLFTKISNKTKDRHWIYCPIGVGIPEAEDLLWLSNWKFGNQLESGDEIDVRIFMGENYQVKECGIGVVYGKQKEEEESCNFAFFSWRDVVASDLPSFQLSTGAYFLCRGIHHLLQASEQKRLCCNVLPIKMDPFQWWSGTSWLKDMFGSSVEAEEISRWGWHGQESSVAGSNMFIYKQVVGCKCSSLPLKSEPKFSCK